MSSALYAGIVTHERFRPKRHRLRYRVFQALFDLDEIDALAGRLRLFAHNRFGLFAFHDADYGDRSGRPLREQIEGHLRYGGIEPDGGPIRLLTMPRVLGHVFNPISIWFCHRRDESLAAIVYEVTNTFHDRHFYLVPVDPDVALGKAGGAVIRQTARKRMYVSPFMDMDMAYDFTIQPPCERIGIVIDGSDGGGKLITACFTGKRRPLDDATLLCAFAISPLLTLKVVAGIHWEALKLWVKGMRIRRRPAPPAETLTIGH